MTMAAASTSQRGGREPSVITWTPANVVTVVRICLIPVFVILMLAPWGDDNVRPWVSMAVYALISLTDSIDGYLARSRNEITTFGKFMDPIADKLLVMAAMLVLVQLGTLPSWIPLVVVAREFLVSGLRMIVASSGTVIAASVIGKAKTFVTLVAVCAFIIKDTPVLGAAGPVVNVLAWALMYAAVVLTVISMVDYFAKSWPLLSDSPAHRGRARRDETSADARDGQVTPSAASPASDAPRQGTPLADTPLRGEELARAVVQAAIDRHVRLGTAESLTGGLICAALTSVPGSSAVVAGGVASYMASVKQSVLSVPGRTIETQGVVSSQTAAAMARGARSLLHVDVAVSVTGVAGPGGGTPETPVGTVWFGLATPDGQTSSQVMHFEGSREEVRAQTVDHALGMLFAAITDE